MEPDSHTAATRRVLVVEDDDTTRSVLASRIDEWGYRSETAASVSETREIFRSFDPDIVVADLVLPDGSGLEVVDLVDQRADGHPRAVFVMTGHASIDRAVDAMKRGADDFLTKPLDTDKLRSLMKAACDRLETRHDIQRLKDKLDRDEGLEGLVGHSEGIQDVFETVKMLGRNDASAIITGESGTGKELVARAVHRLSGRAGGPFVAVNAAAIPKGLIESELFGHEKGAFTGATRSREGCFEQADGGTLLLDEIAEMPLELQPKLLRILEEGRTRRVGGSTEVEFDVRVLAATNADPEKALEEGRLREDLFFRLNVFHVEIPPLRDRISDIPLLAQHFINFFNGKHGTDVEGCSDDAVRLMRRYDWPGNVRELRNVVERGVIMAGDGLLGKLHLPPYMREEDGDPEHLNPRLDVSVGMSVADVEKRLILRTLQHTGGNKTEAARKLGLTPKTIRNKLKKWEDEEGEDAED